VNLIGQPRLVDFPCVEVPSFSKETMSYFHTMGTIMEVINSNGLKHVYGPWSAMYDLRNSYKRLYDRMNFKFIENIVAFEIK